MADFGINATSLAEPSGAGSTPIQGVETPASQYTLPSGILNIGVQAIDDVRQARLKDREDYSKAVADRQKNSAITGYVERVTNIRKAGQDAGLSASEINARIRAQASEFAITAADMGILDEAKKANDFLFSAGTEGQISGQAEDLAKERQRKITFLGGQGVYIPADANDAYVEAQMAKVAERTTLEREFDNTVKRNAEDRANTSFNQGQVDRATKEAAVSMLSKYAASHFSTEFESSNSVVKDVLSGKIAVDTGKGILTKSRMQVNSVLNQMALSNPELVNPTRQIFNDLFDKQEQRLSDPSKNLEVEINTLVNKTKLMALQTDPDTLGLVAASSLLGQTISGTLSAENAFGRVAGRLVMTDTTSSNSVPNLVGSSDKTAEDSMFTMSKDALKLVRSGKAINPDQTKQEAFQLTNNILDMLGDRRGSGKLTRADLHSVVKFMDTPEFAYFVKEGGMNPDVASTAKIAYQQLYEESVVRDIGGQLSQTLPMGALERNRQEGPDNLPPARIMDSVDITYSDGRVKFVAKPDLDVGDVSSRGSKKQIVEGQIKKLQESNDRLNQIIRVGAALEGTTDYQKYWEDNKARILPDYFTNKDMPIGTVVDGYKLKAFPYTLQSNWERVDGGTE